MSWTVSVLCAVICLNGAIAQNEFQLVFRAVAGIAVPDPYDLWVGNSALNENVANAKELTNDFQGHYKSSAALSWSSLDIDEVKISLYTSGQVVRELVFDGTSSSIESWFATTRIIQSPWTDLTSTTTAVSDFRVAGTDNGAVVRRFLVTGPYGSCGGDQGWMVMVTRTGVCDFDRPAGIAYPFFLYSNQATSVVWQGDSSMYDYADVFAIFIKLNTVDVPLSIRCMNSNCAVPESVGVIYIEVVISRGFLQLAAKRRRRSSADKDEIKAKGENGMCHAIHLYPVEWSNPSFTPNLASNSLSHKRSKRQAAYIDSAVVKTSTGILDNALAIKDYGPVFMEAEETLTIPIEIVDDLLVEGDETFTVQLIPLISDGSVPRDTFAVTVTILDDDVDPPPEVLVPEFSLDKFMYPVTESVGAIKVTVRRLVDNSKEQSIVLHTADIDAISPYDYSGSPITIQFEIGDDEEFIYLPIIDDSVLESTECMDLILQEPEDGLLGTPSTATIFIKDNDVSYRFSSDIYTANEIDETVQIAILRSGFLGNATGVDFQSFDGSATSSQPGNDFNALDTTVEFGPDESIGYVNIVIVKDGEFENDEYFEVKLKSSNPSEISEPMVARVVIKSNDAMCDPSCMNAGVCSALNICDCPKGFTGDICQTALKIIAGQLTIFEANGFEAVYDSALSNPFTQEYQNLERQVVAELSPVFSLQLSGYRSMEVEGFFEGSIIVQYVVILDITSGVVAERVKQAVELATNSAGFLSGSSLKLTPTLLETVACPTAYCLNSGVCTAADGNFYCLCSVRFTGDRCETEITDAATLAESPVSASQTSSSRLSDAVIGIIAMTLFMIVLVILAFLACGCWYFGKQRRQINVKQQVALPDTQAIGVYGNAPLIVDGGQIFGLAN